MSAPAQGEAARRQQHPGAVVANARALPVGVTGPILDRGMYRASVIGGALGLVLSGWATAAEPSGSTLQQLSTIGDLVEGACLAWAAWQAFSASSSKAGARLLTVISFVLLVLLPVADRVGSRTADRPPLMHVVVFALTAAPFAFKPELALLTAPGMGFVVYLLRRPTMVATEAALDGAILTMTALTFAGTAFLVHRATDRVHAAEAALWTAREDAERLTYRMAERRRWDALIHDKVLGALSLAIRAETPPGRAAASELAGQALSALDDRPTPGRRLTAALEHRAALLGLDLRLTLRELGKTPALDVLQAVEDSVTEALTNVARHSGQNHVAITGCVSSTEVKVRITDSGRGFESPTPPTRAGLRLGIRARMASVGGRAAVESRSGEGTSITLEWRQQRPQVEPPLHGWDVSTFTPLILLGVLVVLGHLVMGMSLASTRHPALTAFMGLTIVANTVLTASTDHSHPRRFLAQCVIGVLVPAVVTADLIDPSQGDWRYWFAGAQTILVGTVGLRRSARAAVGLATGMILSVAVAQVAAHGQVWLPPLLTMTPQLLATAAVAGLCRSSLDRAAAAVHAAASETGKARLHVAAAEERGAELAARTQLLRSPRLHAALERIARGGPHSEEELFHFIREEQAARDELMAAPVLNADLRDRIARAREGGVSVELIAEHGSKSEGLRPFQDCLKQALSCAAEGARIRATWRPDTEACAATVALVGPRLERSAPADSVQPTGLRVRVTVDEQSILFEVLEPETAPCRQPS